MDWLIVFLVAVVLLILFMRITSSYTAGTPANDRSVISQPVFDSSGNYQDIDPTVAPWTTAANYVLEPDSTMTWSASNAKCWTMPNCVGIRHNFDTHQTWYLMQPIGTTRTSVPSVNNPTVQYNGASYTLPLAIVANKSTQDPAAPVNCTWTPTTGACSTSACNTPGTVTTTYTIGTPAAHGGVCSPAPASTSVPCNTNNQCPWVPPGFFQ